ncbi:glycosyltransferase family 4 protein [Candidatus Woesearchaeota archaeon]|nr:glycosyltransferase family 4 protein [Candidatus Woesearchaeota archaeon]
MEKKNLAVISSRLKCVDAISVEADKWIDKYVKLGYNVHLVSGKFGEPTDLPKFEIPEMDYKHPEIRGMKSILFSARLDKQGRKAAEILLNMLVKRIKGPLKNYLQNNRIQVLSIEDALLSFKNIPLAVALSEIVRELGIPTVSRYHYIPWENPYFAKFENLPKLLKSLPATGKNVVHITTTDTAREMLQKDRRINSKVIPNTMDLGKLQANDWYNKDFRKDLGIRPDQLVFLQPTRVKRNKFVERSIKLVAEINDITKKDSVLVITGSPVYSRGNYFEEVVKRMKKQGVNVIFANDRIFLGRHENPEQKFYSIHDAYVNADIVLYPSAGDAFGNPIIEAAAYRKPVVVGNFPNLKGFTEKGFSFVVAGQKVDAEVVSDTYQLIADKARASAMVEQNFALLKQHYSSDILDDTLIPILNGFEEEESFMSKVAGLFPKALWSRDEKKPKQPQKGFRKSREKKGFKGKGADGEHDKKGPNLVNRKGGYKEPKK